MSVENFKQYSYVLYFFIIVDEHSILCFNFHLESILFIAVIGNKLDGPMLSTILMCLEKNFTPELTLEYLNTIVHLPRFNIVKMFLKEPEKQGKF